MSSSQDTGDGGRRDDIVAGEYVLGVLSLEARRAIEARIETDAAFAERVARWESEFAVLNVDYEAVEPPSPVLAALEDRLFARRSNEAATEPPRGLWGSLVFWRLATALCVIITLVMAGMTAGLFEFGTTRPLVAELASKGSPMNLVALYDSARGTIRLTPVAAGAPSAKSLELWMINGKNPPVSLGVLPQNGRGELVVPEDVRRNVSAGTVLAISLEPPGGSPTGAPTGPVVAAGPARAL